MMQLSDLRALLERLSSGHYVRRENIGDELMRVAYHFHDCVKPAGGNGDPWRAIQLTPLGTALLQALRDAERVPELERERDEARRAVVKLARITEYCDGHCLECEVKGDCNAETLIRHAYTSTGGTVPAESDAPSRPTQ